MRDFSWLSQAIYLRLVPSYKSGVEFLLTFVNEIMEFSKLFQRSPDNSCWVIKTVVFLFTNSNNSFNIDVFQTCVRFLYWLTNIRGLLVF